MRSTRPTAMTRSPMLQISSTLRSTTFHSAAARIAAASGLKKTGIADWMKTNRTRSARMNSDSARSASLFAAAPSSCVIAPCSLLARRELEQLPAPLVGQHVQRAVRTLDDLADALFELRQQPLLADDLVVVE